MTLLKSIITISSALLVVSVSLAQSEALNRGGMGPGRGDNGIGRIDPGMGPGVGDSWGPGAGDPWGPGFGRGRGEGRGPGFGRGGGGRDPYPPAPMPPPPPPRHDPYPPAPGRPLPHPGPGYGQVETRTVNLQQDFFRQEIFLGQIFGIRDLQGYELVSAEIDVRRSGQSAVTLMLDGQAQSTAYGHGYHTFYPRRGFNVIGRDFNTMRFFVDGRAFVGVVRINIVKRWR